MTIIELIIVAAMLGAVFAALLTFIAPTMQNLRTVSRLSKLGREGPSVLRMIERDLANAYADARMEHVFEANMDGDNSELRFTTSRNSVRFLNGQQSDITECGYRVKEDRKSGSLVLYRREDFSLDKEPIEGGSWIPVATNVVQFKCYLYDLPETGIEDDRDALTNLRLGSSGSEGVEEKEDWDRSERRLPYAIKVVLRIDVREDEDFDFENEDDEIRQSIQTYVTIIRLPPFSRNLPKDEDAEEIRVALNPRPAPPNPNANNTNNNTNNNNNTNTGNN